jgi:hypothetical protein
MASRLLVMRLNSVDLPTLGRPDEGDDRLHRAILFSWGGRRTARRPGGHQQRVPASTGVPTTGLPSVGRRSCGSPSAADRKCTCPSHRRTPPTGRPPARRSALGRAAFRWSRPRRRWPTRQAVRRSLASPPNTRSLPATAGAAVLRDHSRAPWPSTQPTAFWKARAQTGRPGARPGRPGRPGVRPRSCRAAMATGTSHTHRCRAAGPAHQARHPAPPAAVARGQQHTRPGPASAHRQGAAASTDGGRRGVEGVHARSTASTKTRSPATSGAVTTLAGTRLRQRSCAPSKVTTSLSACHHAGKAAVAAHAGRDGRRPGRATARRRSRPAAPARCRRPPRRELAVPHGRPPSTGKSMSPMLAECSRPGARRSWREVLQRRRLGLVGRRTGSQQRRAATAAPRHQRPGRRQAAHSAAPDAAGAAAWAAPPARQLGFDQAPVVELSSIALEGRLVGRLRLVALALRSRTSPRRSATRPRRSGPWPRPAA